MVSDIWTFFTTSDNWSGDGGILTRLFVHLWVSFLGVATAAAIAIPAGIAVGHSRRGQVAATGLANLGRAIPSLAVLGFVVAAGGGIGFLPTYVAMFALALPPMFVSSSVGVSEIDRGIIDAGRGLGMRTRELIRRIELPLAMPLILSGVRIATSQVIATATLGAFVGYNTLGRFITVGRANLDNGMLYGGVILVVGLALIAELGFRVLERRLTPWRRRTPQRRRSRTSRRSASAVAGT